MTTPTRTPPICPHCGDPLTATKARRGPQAPPWLCLRDSRGWETPELTEAARRAYRPAYRDFGAGPAGRGIAQAAERLAADRREAQRQGNPPVGS